MKGAKTDPWLILNKAAIIIIIEKIGANHSFFRLRKKLYISLINDISPPQN